MKSDNYDVQERMLDGRRVIFVSDPNDGGYTAWYADDPGAITQGDTIEDCLKSLPTALELLLGNL